MPYTEALNALNMVVDEINEEGGLNGVKVEVVVYDDQGSPEEAVKAVTKLINVDKIDACISSCVSSCILASAGALNDAKIITFGTGLSPTYMDQGWDYVFRACVNSDFVAPLTVDLAKDLNVASVAIFRGQDESAIAPNFSWYLVKNSFSGDGGGLQRGGQRFLRPDHQDHEFRCRCGVHVHRGSYLRRIYQTAPSVWI